MDERERVLLTLAGVRVIHGRVLARQPALEAPDRLRRGRVLGPAAHLDVARTHAHLAAACAASSSTSSIPHLTVLGWIVFVAGLLTGLSLVLGLLTSWERRSASLQAIAITLLLGNAPGEWLYGYLMLILLSALLLLLPGRRAGMSLDDALGRDP